MEKYAENLCAWYVCLSNTFGLGQTNNILQIFKCMQQKSIRKQARSYINYKEFFYYNNMQDCLIQIYIYILLHNICIYAQNKIKPFF